MKSVRCAIYTRKSSDEGLEQGFNSLDAQREACAAYILSQASEGWMLVPELYDDGGFSGGTLERPALQRLLADMNDGRIDIIVVYKVDRLTRSLLDFAKLVETFDKAGASFVSITQSFNTTTSMGRLTLNMLLSFAQFEREVTAERIRDKIAASKAKGMWMGGAPPLGYQPDGRSLAIVESEAVLIRRIFARYLDLGAVRLVAEELVRDAIKTPARIRVNGATLGGRSFSRGQLYAILKNPVYGGNIAHKGQVYPGLHAPIVARDVWDRAQLLLADHLNGERSPTRAARGHLLARLLVDAEGRSLVAAHANKGKVRYRYYISRELQHGASPDGLRIPAPEIEGAVVTMLNQLFADPLALAARAGLDLAAQRMAHHIRDVREFAKLVERRDSTTIRSFVQQVRVLEQSVEIDVCRQALAKALGAKLSSDIASTLTLKSEMQLRRSGRALRLVHTNGTPLVATVDQSLAKLIATAHRWWNILKAGEFDVTRLAEVEKVTASWMTRVLRLAFLSPQITQSILDGTGPTLDRQLVLLKSGAVAPDWHIQAQIFNSQAATPKAASGSMPSTSTRSSSTTVPVTRTRISSVAPCTR